MGNFLTINNVAKTYKSENETIIALENINFNVNRGEFITIAGPSGCGKSTLLHLIADLI